MYTTLVIMMAAAFTGKVMGLLRDRMMAVHFGTSSVEGIAFMQASVLPRQFLDIIFAAVFSASFIPVFNEYLHTKGKQAAFDLASHFFIAVAVITTGLTVLFIGLSLPIYNVFLWNAAADPAVRDLGVQLLRVLFPLMILSGLAFSLASMLQSLGNFNVPAAMSIVSNGVILIYYVFFIERFGIYGLAVAFLLGWSGQVFIQMPFLIKQKFRFCKFPLRFWKHEGLRKIASLALPVMVATWALPVNLLVNGRASVGLYGGQHGYVAINLAFTLYSIITGLFVLQLANFLLPQLSRLASAGNLEGFAAFMRSSFRQLMFLLLPMTFGLMAVAHPLVRLVFQDGAFQYESVEITAAALFYFSIGTLGFGMQVILNRGFFALQHSRAPLIAGGVAMIANLILSFVLAPVMEIGGPALASSSAMIISAGLLFYLLRTKLAGLVFWSKDMTVDGLKMLGLSVMVFFAARGVLYVVEGWFIGDGLMMRIASVMLPAGAGVGIYVVGTFLFGVQESRSIAKFLYRKIYRR